MRDPLPVALTIAGALLLIYVAGACLDWLLPAIPSFPF